MVFRVLTAEFKHETNTFNKRKTDLSAFKAQTFVVGGNHLETFEGTNTGVAGCLECARKFGWNMHHAVTADTGPSGLVTSKAFDTITNLILEAARAKSPDGVLLALHGAMVVENFEDGEGELLQRLRDTIGPDIPIAITLDLHANVTAKMCKLTDIVVSYKTYPHIDIRETACHAGNILQRTMTGEISPTTLLVRCPMLREANDGRTDIGPMVDRLKNARAYEDNSDVFAVSINAGFEGSDITEVGPTALVTYQGDSSNHQLFAESIIEDIWERRSDVINSYYTVEEAAKIAVDFLDDKGPLLIADFADNPGGGAYGDATSLLAALLKSGVTNACFGSIADPSAAMQCHQHSTGESITLDLGGKTDPNFGGGPITVTGKIELLSDGRCIGDGPMMNGQTINFGKTCVLRVEGIDILIVSEAIQIIDQQQFRGFGIDPTSKSIIVLKSMQHFRAAFEPIANKIIVCESGALCTTDVKKLPYQNVPRPIYPLDPNMVRHKQ